MTPISDDAAALILMLERVASMSGLITRDDCVDLQADFSTTMAFLEGLGLVSQGPDSGSYAVVSDVASVFMRSLVQYIRAGKPALEGWSRWSTPDDTGPQAQNGPHLLLSMEEARAGWNDPTPIRTTSVSQIVVKARYRWRLGERFLVRWDSKARCFQLVGGHQLPMDADSEETIVRELQEEIPALLGHGVYQLSKGPSAQVAQVSRTVGALTLYRMQFYTISFAAGPPPLSHAERWVTQEEMEQQCTRDGRRINLVGLSRAVGNLGEWLRSIPASYQQQIPPAKREVAAQFTKWVLVPLGIIGGLVAVIQLIIWIVSATTAGST